MKHVVFWVIFLAKLEVSVVHSDTITLNLASKPLYYKSNAVETTELCYRLQLFTQDVLMPLSLRYPPGDPHRLFVSEQRGVIWVFSNWGQKLATEPFLNISHVVAYSGERGDERGLLQLAFHPRFQQNLRFYIYYSLKKHGIEKTRVSELVARRHAANSHYSAVETSEKILLEIDQPYPNNNGGEVVIPQPSETVYDSINYSAK